MKPTCELKNHQRLTWAVLSTFFAGMGCAWLLGGPPGYSLLPIPALVAGFCAGVYLGFIRLEAPKKKPMEVSPSVEPTQQSPK